MKCSEMSLNEITTYDEDVAIKFPAMKWRMMKCWWWFVAQETNVRWIVVESNPFKNCSSYLLKPFDSTNFPGSKNTLVIMDILLTNYITFNKNLWI